MIADDYIEDKDFINSVSYINFSLFIKYIQGY